MLLQLSMVRLDRINLQTLGMDQNLGRCQCMCTIDTSWL